jgi:hypothetical protein
MASKIYAFPAGEIENKSYAVTVDGIPVKAHEARVSAMPFNRNWPGHQRPMDQTELAPFISFGLNSPVEIRVIPRKPFLVAIVRPLSRGIVPRAENSEIIFTIPEAGQYTLELDGTREALHIFADPAKKFNVSPGDPDTLYFGPGIHDAGTIELKSGQTLYIDAGAVVFGQIHAADAENIRILGNGILDHSRFRELAQDPQANPHLIDPLRPSPLLLQYCRHVEIDGLVIRDPCFLAVRPVACENLTIDNIKIIGCWRYNSDGIDFINSKHCRVRGSFVRTFDDSLNLKGFYFLNQGEMFHNHQTFDVMDDVVYERCVVWNEWGNTLVLGCDLCGKEVVNCAFRDCDLIHLHGHTAFGVNNVDYSEVHHLLFDNIRVEYDPVIQKPVFQKSDDQVFADDPDSTYMPYLFHSTILFSPYSHGGTVRGQIHDITFRNIQVTAGRMPPSLFSGFDDKHRVSSVCIENLTLNGKKITSVSEANIVVGPYVEDITLS